MQQPTDSLVLEFAAKRARIESAEFHLKRAVELAYDIARAAEASTGDGPLASLVREGATDAPIAAAARASAALQALADWKVREIV
jgi:hypothetical protein